VPAYSRLRPAIFPRVRGITASQIDEQMRAFRNHGGLRRADHALTTITGRLPRHAAVTASLPLSYPSRSLLHTRASPTAVCYPTKASRITNTTPRRTCQPTRLAPLTSVRHCSHRRNMCRHAGADVHSHVDVTKSREVLPANVKPVHYDLTLEPDFEKFTYWGSVTIEYVRAREDSEASR
jgi:aminopeptidase 2